mgnify:CR=1 FL=1
MQEKGQNISPVKRRILYFIDSLLISKREFYSKTGISRGTLESNTGITEDTMAKFIATFPEVSLDWLILGEGDMIRKTTPSPEERDIMELSRKLVEAKDEIIELQKAHIESLMERIRLMLPSRR